jgi:peroxiredoxin
MPLPRYKFDVGQRLTYRHVGDVAVPDSLPADQPSTLHCIEWNFQVIDRNSSGQSRIIFSQSSSTETKWPGGESRTSGFSCEGYFDLSELGQITENRTTSPLANPSILFPPLPASEEELASGWRANLALDRTQREFISAETPTASSTWRFQESSHTELDPIYVASRTRDYEFDIDRGCVTKASTTFHRNWPTDAGHATTDIIDLVDVVRSEDSRSAALIAESNLYFAACAEYQRLIDLAFWDLSTADASLAMAEKTLVAFAAVAHSDPINSWARRKHKLHTDELDDLLTSCNRLAHRIGQRAPEWRASDLHGKTHRSTDYAGKPLVLCFWNRGCAWAIRTLITLNEFDSDPAHSNAFNILGVCTDHDRESVQEVWHALGITFSTVYAVEPHSGLHNEFEIDSFPTTIVIDRDGIIRRLREGHSPQLPILLEGELLALSTGRGPIP